MQSQVTIYPKTVCFGGGLVRLCLFTGIVMIFSTITIAFPTGYEYNNVVFLRDIVNDDELEQERVC